MLPILVWAAEASADCGLDVVCIVAASAAQGATPLVTDVMEREAPALIGKLQIAIDHNIITAEEAGKRVALFATALLNKTVADTAITEGKLILFAREQADSLAKNFFQNLNVLVDRLNCQTLGVNALISSQQNILSDNVNAFLSRLPLTGRNNKTKVDEMCRRKFSLPVNAPASSLGLPSTFDLWRCVRLSYVDLNSSAGAIRAAYRDVEASGWGVVCALGKSSGTAVQDALGIWIDDGLSAKAWARVAPNH